MIELGRSSATDRTCPTRTSGGSIPDSTRTSRRVWTAAGGELTLTERDRAIGLYTFLKEFVQLRTRTIRDVSSYEQDGEVIWAADIPREHGCHCAA